MFKGFSKKFVKVKKGKIFCRVGGKGFPLLLLHGYPQTHLMWHKTVGQLSKSFKVIVADLRGYGSSLILKSDNKHLNYSKKEMAKDMMQLMSKLGYKKFFIAGHDRGGRVAHRMAKDYRKSIIAMSVLDICPTLDMYEQTKKEFAKAYFHWFFLIQPKFLPENMINVEAQEKIIESYNIIAEKDKEIEKMKASGITIADSPAEIGKTLIKKLSN